MSLRGLAAALIGVGVFGAGVSEAQAPASPAQHRGKPLYDAHCATCHGPDGRADTPVGRLLNPRPRNFADPIEMARVSPDRIYHAIKEGRPGTAMAAWGQVLAEIQIGDVMDYVGTFAEGRGTGLTAEQLSLEVGRRTFERECTLCHGRDGSAKTEASRVLRPAPNDLSDPFGMASIDDGRLYTAIKLGIRGTGMAGWGELLSPAEIIDLMRYVRALERPLPPGTTRAGVDLAVGRKLYGQHCAACHGDKGDADTPLGRVLAPRPRDLTRTREMAALPDALLVQAITNGKPGTSMAPWRGVLSAEDVRRVILFIRQVLQGGS